MELFAPISTMRGVGEAKAKSLEKLGIETPYDLLYHLPRSYIDYTTPQPVNFVQNGEQAVLRVRILQKLPPAFIRKNMTVYKCVATDDISDITVVIYNNVYLFQSLQKGTWYRMHGKIQGNLLRKEIVSPSIIPDRETDLYFPCYPLTTGITSAFLSKLIKQVLPLTEQISDWCDESLRQQHDLIPLTTALQQIHFPTTTQSMEQAKRRLAFDEMLQLQVGMLMRKEAAKEESAYPMKKIDLQPFYDSLPFTMTNGQFHAVEEITKDLSGNAPMNRLLQGDVGSGKTAVAAAACFYAVKNGYQCALMAPTEILAQQHYHTLQGFLENLGITVALLTGSAKVKERRAINQQLMDGTIQILVGTHAIFQKEVTFQKLAFVIMDEQHRFGVAQRTALADKGGSPHKLVMSATPIPRTLALMIYGDLDISILNELPGGRKPVLTYAVTGGFRQRAFSFIQKELDAGHQGYIVCPMIDESDKLELQSVTAYAEQIQQSPFGNYKVGLLHGRMKNAEKDSIMEQFRNGEIHLLVSTTVIEVGVDVPNATILLIENAERFGLSQLHQLRGRVGRGQVQSYCILMTDHVTEDCRKRMKIMSSTTDGFKIAEADLELRGPGDFFGEKQHGLPPLKIADLSGDSRFLEEVRATANGIVESDPTLEEHQGLRVEVLRLFRRSGTNGRN